VEVVLVRVQSEYKGRPIILKESFEIIIIFNY
jgi:hypothetical protein